MNKYIICFFIVFNAFGQNFPISESNAFVYNKTNYGNDFFNIAVSPEIAPNGSIIVQPYSDSFIWVGNFSSNYLFKNKDGIYSQMHNTFYHNDTTWVVERSKINLLIKNKLQKKYILNHNNHTSHFVYYKQKIYFLSHTTDYSKTEACVFQNGKISVLKIVDNAIFSHFISSNNDLIFAFQKKESLEFYQVKNKSTILLKSYKIPYEVHRIYNLVNENHFYFISHGLLYVYKNGKASFVNDFSKYNNLCFHQNHFSYSDNETAYIFDNTNPDKMVANTSFNKKIITLTNSKPTNSFYCGTTVGLIRLFPHIKKYPRLYNNSNSNAVFGLVQNKEGKIFAGSYNGGLSIINQGKVQSIAGQPVLNAMNYKGDAMLFLEYQKGVEVMKDIKQVVKIADSVSVFYGYNNKEKLYLGTADKGIWYKNNKDVYNQTIKWRKINSKNNFNLTNTLSIAEDKNGIIWAGSGRGIAFYNPKTDKATTWTLDKKQIPFRGSMTFLKDSKETLWIGTLTGELYYFDGKKYESENLIKINHPLLEAKNVITFIHQWKDYLILGAKDKVLLFDLKQWYQNKTIHVKYLNPLESNITNVTEQNAIFTDINDKSIWFSTSDMLYQWDIKKWLSLPTFKVNPTIIVKKGSISNIYNSDKVINFDASENSFDFSINYQTKDNLPRYVNGSLVKKGEKPEFDYPNLKHDFHFANLSSGEYIFYVRICQQDGSYTIHEYEVCIDNFLYQKWWFWALILLLFLGLLSYFYRQKIEKEKTKKKMSQLNLASLSNQFRPHFMLNALNSISSQVREKPHATKIIKKLGESISILYSVSQKNEFTHFFINEWKLTDNIIEILKTIYIPNLELKISGLEIINETYKIPVGLIQIPVENALLHGLRNVEIGACILEIIITENPRYYIIQIKDNGIGREKSKTINTFKKNGNGIKTIQEMIKIINNFESKSIFFDIIDLEIGTEVIIKLKKDISYEKIVL